MTCKCHPVIGGPSVKRVICKSCGKEWTDYRRGSADWQPRDCHACEAKKTVDKILKTGPKPE